MIITNKGKDLSAELLDSLYKAFAEKKTYAWIYDNLGISRRCVAKYKKEWAIECND